MKEHPKTCSCKGCIMANAPAVLNQITDVVLAYRPKPKSKGAKRRVRRAKKVKADD